MFHILTALENENEKQWVGKQKNGFRPTCSVTLKPFKFPAQTECETQCVIWSVQVHAQTGQTGAPSWCTLLVTNSFWLRAVDIGEAYGEKNVNNLKYYLIVCDAFVYLPGLSNSLD